MMRMLTAILAAACFAGPALAAGDAAAGKQKSQVCAACHGADGKGNQTLGAPNLTDKIWEYGGSLADVVETITKGRGVNALTPGASAMPAHRDSLGEAKVHILAAYVYSLSNPKP
jgi:cytochrome c oxidase cbb3-type subunit 3